MKTQGVVWRNGRWADEFVIVASNDGHFITLFTKKEDPAKDALKDFMTGRFERLDAKRSLPWSALLFRTLAAELAASQGPWEPHVAFSVAPETVRNGYRAHPQYRPYDRPIVPFLIERPVNGVRVYVAPGGIMYVTAGNVQFSFHAIPSTPAITRFAASCGNERQEWSGRRLQAISPAVLAWGRAVFQAERLTDGSPAAL